MPFCTSGSPQAKPGIADDVILTAAVISSMLPAGAVWLEPFIGAIAGIITIHLPTLCGVDPEADPGLTGADVLSLVALGPGPLTADAYDRFTQLVRRFAWFTFCQCSGGSTPAEPSFPSAPTGLPAINPPGVVGVPAGPCQTDTRSVTVLTTDTRRDVYTNTLCDQTGHPTCQSLATPIPAGATAMQWHSSNHGVDPIVCTPGHFAIVTAHWAAAGAYISGSIFAANVDSGTLSCIDSAAHSDVIPIPSGATQVTLTAEIDGYAHSVDFDVSITWFCGVGTAPVTGLPTCCTADPFTSGSLTQILQLVTLIQRYLAPFAYQNGATHSGLTGHAVLTIPTLVGVLITLTTVPSSVGQEIASPDQLWDAGWITWGNADGFTERVWIGSNPQLSLPPNASTFTRLGYTLRSGVVASIQELYAET